MAQYRPPVFLGPQTSTPQNNPTASNPNIKLPFVRQNPPPRDRVDVHAGSQTVEGDWVKLRGAAMVDIYESTLQADEIDYNTETGEAHARGNVHYRNYEEGEEIFCDKADYNTKDVTGKFYNVRGTFAARIDARPGILTSSNPFQFQGEWAERLQQKYILYKGTITSCTYPRPWWTLRSPKFDIVPNQRATMQRAFFRVLGVPVFYFPYFYKSLEKQPRRSGFLTPNFGNSSRYGQMFGAGYFWAINRSYDATYRSQYFTERGFAHTFDFRGKPTDKSDFDFFLYGVGDRGKLQNDGTRLKQGGYTMTFNGKADLGHGWHGRVNFNYLSSLTFRQNFTQSYNEAISSEVNAVGYVEKQWRGNNVQIVASRSQNFQTPAEGDSIIIRKLPQVEYTRRDTQIWKTLPVWVSLESSAGLVSRSQPLFQTRQFVSRLDATPRVSTALHWKGFHLTPSVSLHETYWASSREGTTVLGSNVTRSARDIQIDFLPPSLAKVFEKSPKWMGGGKMKHVIEPKATFRYVSGINDFEKIIRFDQTELLTNTKELEFGVTNRLYVKRGQTTQEFLSWQVWQKRYFDPTFGGTIIDGRRNVNQSSLDFTGFAFLDRARNYSPVASSLRMQPLPGTGVEWRTDYDPLRGHISNSSLTVDGRVNQWFVSAGHTQVDSNVVLSPKNNQFRGLLGWGGENRRGWSTAFFAIYDYRLAVLQFANTQVTYNTDCCGFSVQYRRLSFGTINENQFRMAFSIANIGSFGTLRRQERYF
ncbi:LPS-assembly protein LptD [Bryobacter aggregatus]|uniref:LPS-assembly protein LptD n=1 Tax=Bryobacter aggregatus TaxID=360054 RepID=UPI0004E1F5EA|nr:LPS assembly protein LptD [Bryobacter aggregatus]